MLIFPLSSFFFFGPKTSVAGNKVAKILSGKLRERRGELTELDSQILGRETVRFISPNNTLILAHQGSAVTLSCRLNKTPYFGMVKSHLCKAPYKAH